MQNIQTLLGLLPLLLAAACNEQIAYDTGPEPPLILAAERGDLQSLDRLLAESPAADVRDQCQWTPLMKAALYGHEGVVRRLLQAGARPNATDKGGYSALMLAASNNHAGVIQLLAEHGADLDHREPGLGWSALIWAARQGRAEAVKVLLERGANPRLLDKAGNSAADWARKNDHQQVLVMLQTKDR